MALSQNGYNGTDNIAHRMDTITIHADRHTNAKGSHTRKDRLSGTHETLRGHIGNERHQIPNQQAIQGWAERHWGTKERKDIRTKRHKTYQVESGHTHMPWRKQHDDEGCIRFVPCWFVIYRSVHFGSLCLVLCNVLSICHLALCQTFWIPLLCFSMSFSSALYCLLIWYLMAFISNVSP